MGVRTITVTVTVDPSKVGPGLAVAAAEVDRFTARTVAKGAAVDAGFGKDFGKVIRGNLSQLSGDVARFTTQTQGLGSLLGSTFAGGLKIGGSTAAVVGLGAAAAALAVGLGAAAASAVPFDAAMRNVNSIAGQSEAAFKLTEQSVLDLSTTVPQSATQLAKGLYEVESSNFHAADGLHVLDVSAKAASAGLTDTDTATKAITGALNAYGLSAASAGDVSDVLFQTVNKGIVTFADVSQQLGDFVGTAAAARVPLQDAASAFAAITLAGVPAAEASTSLNQLLTKLIKPTTELSAAYKQLGYESGASALQQKGLHGVIEDIGKVTGGSAEQLVKMFNDVRAARGVLALLSAGGKNYQTALDGIANASARTGATQRAFNEQMKSTQAQLTLLKNDAVKTGIELGLRLLPPFNAFLQMARQAGAEALPFLHAALTRVAPVFQQLWGILSDLVKVFADLARDAAPFVKAIAQIAAAVTIAPLLLFLDVLKSITGFLADHRSVVQGVAAIYLTRFIPALLGAGDALLAQIGRLVLATTTLGTYEGVIVGADNALKGISASSIAAGAASAALAASLFVLIRTFSNASQTANESKAIMDKVQASFDALDPSKSQRDIDQLTQTYLRGKTAAAEYSGVVGNLKAVFSRVFGDDTAGRLLQQGKDAGDTLNALSAKAGNANENLDAVAHTTGMTVTFLRQLAEEQHIDLSGTFNSSADARKRLIDYVHDFQKANAGATAAYIQQTGASIDAAAEFEKELQKIADTAQGAFQKDTDVLGQYADAVSAASKAQDGLNRARGKSSGSTGSQDLRDRQRIARDEQAIRDAEQRAIVSHSKTLSGEVSHQQSINRARQKLADDQALIGARTKSGAGSSAVDTAAAKAHAAAASADLSKLYSEALSTSRAFIADINAAIQRGLDPSVVSKLLAEGPKRAEPALRAILADHSGNLVKMVNASETALSRMSGFVGEQARIAARAMNAPTDEYTRNVKVASQIAAQEWSDGGRLSAQALARSLHLSVKDVRHIAHLFGITLAHEVQAGVNANGPVRVHADGTVDFSPSFGRKPRGVSVIQSVFASLRQPRAEGGEIYGAPGRDTNLAAVTRGEWVMPVAAVQTYGKDFMESLRTRSFPRFADGGLVGRDGGWVSSVVSVSGPRIVPVPVPISTRQSSDNSITYNIDKVVANSPWELPDAGPRTYSASRGVS